MQLTVDGADIFVATGGKAFDADLPTVLFLHGAGMDHTAWGQHDRWFSHHGYNVLAPDLPGHGRSAGKLLKKLWRYAAAMGPTPRSRSRRRLALVSIS